MFAVAPSISASDVPSFAIHWYSKVALSSPSPSVMVLTPAVSVERTSVVPVICAAPPGAVFVAGASTRVTVVLVLDPASTHVGSVPNPIATVSPLSAVSSATAVTVTVCESAPPLVNVTLPGAE